MAVWATVMLSELGAAFRLDSDFYTAPGALLRVKLRKTGVAFPDFFRRVVHPAEFVRDYLDEPGHHFLRAQNVKPGVIVDSDPIYVSDEIYNSSPDAVALRDDLLLVRTGANLADLARVTTAWEKSLVSSHTLRLIPRKDAPICGLEFFFVSKPGRHLLLGLRSGGTHGQINASTLRSIYLPDLRSYEPDARDLADQIEQARGTARSALAAAESRLMEALGLDALDLSPSKTYSRNYREMRDERRFDAEYFNPKYQRLIEKLREDGRTLADVASVAERKFRPERRKNNSAFDYIQIGSLTGDGEAEAETLPVADAPSRATWIVKPGDVITSLVRPIRRLSAMIGDDQADCVCSSGFSVLSPAEGPDGIEPEVLLTYLRLPLICELLDLNTTASIYPAIPVERLLTIPILLPNKADRSAIVESVQQSHTARRTAADLLEQAKRRVEELIDG